MSMWLQGVRHGLRYPNRLASPHFRLPSLPSPLASLHPPLHPPSPPWDPPLQSLIYQFGSGDTKGPEKESEKGNGRLDRATGTSRAVLL